MSELRWRRTGDYGREITTDKKVQGSGENRSDGHFFQAAEPKTGRTRDQAALYCATHSKKNNYTLSYSFLGEAFYVLFIRDEFQFLPAKIEK